MTAKPPPRVARGTDFMRQPVGVISTHATACWCNISTFCFIIIRFQPSLCHKHNVDSIINNKITDCNSLFPSSDRKSIEERPLQLFRVFCVKTMIDNNQVTFSKMTVEKFVGSGVMLAAHNRRKREVVSLSEMQTLPCKERRSHYQ